MSTPPVPAAALMPSLVPPLPPVARRPCMFVPTGARLMPCPEVVVTLMPSPEVPPPMTLKPMPVAPPVILSAAPVPLPAMSRPARLPVLGAEIVRPSASAHVAGERRRARHVSAPKVVVPAFEPEIM
jgi:hypothetical protein